MVCANATNYVPWKIGTRAKLEYFYFFCSQRNGRTNRECWCFVHEVLLTGRCRYLLQACVCTVYTSRVQLKHHATIIQLLALHNSLSILTVVWVQPYVWEGFVYEGCVWKLCSYSNCNCRARHLMNDLRMLLPHSRAGMFVHSCAKLLVVYVHIWLYMCLSL